MLRTLFARILVAGLLMTAARAAGGMADLQDTLAVAQEQLLTLGTRPTLDVYKDEQSLPFVARLPVVGDVLRRDVRAQRAGALYWSEDYETLVASPREESAQTDAVLMLIAANARYRQLMRRQPEQAALTRGLRDLLTQYQDILIAQPALVEAASNFEFVARLLEAQAQGHLDALEKSSVNMHGEGGRPPEGVETSEFNVIVPMRREERQERFDSGAGGAQRRQG